MRKLFKTKKGEGTIALDKIVIIILLIALSFFVIYKYYIPYVASLFTCADDCAKNKISASNENFAIEYIGIDEQTLTAGTCKLVSENTYFCTKDAVVNFYVGINNTGPKQNTIIPKIVVGSQCTNNKYEKCETKEWFESSACKNIDTQRDCPVNKYKFQNSGIYVVYPAARCDNAACGTGARCADGLLFLNANQFLTIEVS